MNPIYQHLLVAINIAVIVMEIMIIFSKLGIFIGKVIAKDCNHISINLTRDILVIFLCTVFVAQYFLYIQ